MYNISDVVCDAPVAPSNGTVHVLGDVILPDTKAQYSCQRGFVLVGTDQLSCMDSGQWTRDAPTCQGYFILLISSACIPYAVGHYGQFVFVFT
jgi:hypothetical protein